VVYRLAASVEVKPIVESPVRTKETKNHGTEVVLNDASKKNGKVIIASTLEVYGKSNALHF